MRIGHGDEAASGLFHHEYSLSPGHTSKASSSDCYKSSTNDEGTVIAPFAAPESGSFKLTALA